MVEQILGGDNLGVIPIIEKLGEDAPSGGEAEAKSGNSKAPEIVDLTKDPALVPPPPPPPSAIAKAAAAKQTPQTPAIDPNFSANLANSLGLANEGTSLFDPKSTESPDLHFQWIEKLALGYKQLDEAAYYKSRLNHLNKAHEAHVDQVMDRTLLLLYFKKRYGYQSYLEIGCRGDHNFSRMPFADKVGVDPIEGGNIRATSDQYFAALVTQENTLQAAAAAAGTAAAAAAAAALPALRAPPAAAATPPRRRFDLVFIDGLHESSQVIRDVQNALLFLNPNGTILLHDCKPIFEVEGSFPYVPGTCFWNGNVWKAIALLRTLPDIDVCVGDFDWGLGIVRRRPNSNPLIGISSLEQIDWRLYEARQAELLNIKDFKGIHDWLHLG